MPTFRRCKCLANPCFASAPWFRSRCSPRGSSAPAPAVRLVSTRARPRRGKQPPPIRGSCQELGGGLGRDRPQGTEERNRAGGRDRGRPFAHRGRQLVLGRCLHRETTTACQAWFISTRAAEATITTGTMVLRPMLLASRTVLYRSAKPVHAVDPWGGRNRQSDTRLCLRLSSTWYALYRVIAVTSRAESAVAVE